MPNWLLRKITSRKLWAFVTTATATTVAAYMEYLAWPIAAKYLTAQLLIYIGIEGSIDLARAILVTIYAQRNRIVYDPSVLNSYDVESDDLSQPIRVRRAAFGKTNVSEAIAMVSKAHKKEVNQNEVE